MTYAVFDLDETLASLNTIHYFLMTLKPKTTYAPGEFNPEKMNNIIKHKLDIAYKIFVREILQLELSDLNPLGLLRPGILHAMKELYNLQLQDIIKGVIIYSNNGHLSNLELIRDIIHEYLGTDNLICDCIYWYTPGREEEYTSPKRPGAALKTFQVLKKLLANGPCQASSELNPLDIYFFDDQLHQIKNELPQGHYIHVEQYNYTVPFVTFANIFKKCMYQSGIYGNKELEIPIYSLYGYQATNQNNHTESYINYLRGFQKRNGISPLSSDKGIKEIEFVITKIQESSSNLPINYKGGKGTKRRRKYQKKSRRNNRS